MIFTKINKNAIYNFYLISKNISQEGCEGFELDIDSLPGQKNTKKAPDKFYGVKPIWPIF